MNSDNNNTIITEDGQRLTVDAGLISGTADPKPGLAHQTGNVLDETTQANEANGACPTPANNKKEA